MMANLFDIDIKILLLLIIFVIKVFIIKKLYVKKKKPYKYLNIDQYEEYSWERQSNYRQAMGLDRQRSLF